MTKSKPRLSGYDQAILATTVVKETSEKLTDFIRELQENYERTIDENTAKLTAHVNNPDLRPRIHFKPQAKNRWTIALNDQIYSCGPLDPLPSDEDDPAFFWMDTHNSIHPARSMFQALISILQDFCKPQERVDENPTLVD